VPALLDTSLLIGAESPGDLEGAVSAPQSQSCTSACSWRATLTSVRQGVEERVRGDRLHAA
jgi:hypothetical protein